MTYDDDFVRVHLSIGTPNLTCKAVGLEWPPPERICLDGKLLREATEDDPPDAVLIRDRLSVITDEQRASMTNVARGAEYFYAEQ
jgi:hypothetical protein